MIYRVKQWDEHFEGAKSREYNNKTSCQMPTKHGLGYRKLVRHKHGAALFGAWCALIQVLSKQPKPREGYLTETGESSGRPYSAEDLELLTDIPASHFTELLQVASSEAVGWLEIPHGYHADTTRILQETDKEPRGGIDSDLDSNSDSDSNSNSQNAPAGAEGGYTPDFIKFWKAYPRKVNKMASFKEWKKAKRKPPVDEIIAKVEEWKDSPQWMKDGGAYIVHPERFIKNRRWEDTVEIEANEVRWVMPTEEELNKPF